MLRCEWLVFNSYDWCVSILTVPVGCSLSGPLFCSSSIVVFFERGHPCFWNFYSTLLVDVVRVKSYVNRHFDPARVPKCITINKLYLVPKQVVSGPPHSSNPLRFYLTSEVCPNCLAAAYNNKACALFSSNKLR